MNLNENQKEFLFYKFFCQNRHQDSYGWHGIASKLIKDGKCIVAGTDMIWRGGIGNFIDIEPAPDAYECTLYTFDLKEFMSSKYFTESFENELKKRKDKIIESQKNFNDLNSLYNLI